MVFIERPIHLQDKGKGWLALQFGFVHSEAVALIEEVKTLGSELSKDQQIVEACLCNLVLLSSATPPSGQKLRNSQFSADPTCSGICFSYVLTRICGTKMYWSYETIPLFPANFNRSSNPPRLTSVQSLAKAGGGWSEKSGGLKSFIENRSNLTDMCWYMLICGVPYMGYPFGWMNYKGTSYINMGDDWGYL